MKKIHKGDTVIVRTGKDKGKISTVQLICGQKAILENLNMVTRHMRPDPKREIAGLYKKPMPIPLSNLALYDREEKKPGKVKFVLGAVRADKARYFKHSNKALN